MGWKEAAMTLEMLESLECTNSLLVVLTLYIAIVLTVLTFKK